MCALGIPHNATKQLVCWDLKARINLEVPNMCGCCSPRELVDSLICDKATHASKKQRLEPDNADLYVVFLQLQNTVPTSISIESLRRTAFLNVDSYRDHSYHFLSITVYHWKNWKKIGAFFRMVISAGSLPLPIRRGPHQPGSQSGSPAIFKGPVTLLRITWSSAWPVAT